MRWRIFKPGLLAFIFLSSLFSPPLAFGQLAFVEQDKIFPNLSHVLTPLAPLVKGGLGVDYLASQKNSSPPTSSANVNSSTFEQGRFPSNQPRLNSNINDSSLKQKNSQALREIESNANDSSLKQENRDKKSQSDKKPESAGKKIQSAKKPQTLDELLKQIQKDQLEQKPELKAREARFLKARDRQKALLKQAAL